MFKGFSSVRIDAKGRLAIPTRYRDLLVAQASTTLVLTLNPWDHCLWFYPEAEWALIEPKLQALSDFDRDARRTKQMMRGYATDCAMDAQGRVRIPSELQQFARLEKRAVFLGQGNKFEVWDAEIWRQERDDWLERVHTGSDSESSALHTLSL